MINNNMLRNFRKNLKLSNKEIETEVGLKNKSSIYYIEKSFKDNKTVKYLLLLREKGVDINAFFDNLNKTK
ncbi:MAG: hypothetical protein HC854_04080 [Flavobacterium sp.]|nr:hypothetical protein [Flavobacterium sp.]